MRGAVSETYELAELNQSPNVVVEGGQPLNNSQRSHAPARRRGAGGARSRRHLLAADQPLAAAVGRPHRGHQALIGLALL